MEIDRPEALESCRLDNASGSSLSVVMKSDFDDEDEAAKELGGDGVVPPVDVAKPGSSKDAVICPLCPWQSVSPVEQRRLPSRAEGNEL